MAAPAAAPVKDVPLASTLATFLTSTQAQYKSVCDTCNANYQIIKSNDATIHKVILIAITVFVLYQGLPFAPLFLVIGFFSHTTVKDHVDGVTKKVKDIWNDSKTAGLTLTAGAFMLGVTMHWQLAALGLGYYIAKDYVKKDASTEKKDASAEKKDAPIEKKSDTPSPSATVDESDNV